MKNEILNFKKKQLLPYLRDILFCCQKILVIYLQLLNTSILLNNYFEFELELKRPYSGEDLDNVVLLMSNPVAEIVANIYV